MRIDDQPDLFTAARGQRAPAVNTPAARATDPDTSHKAAEANTASGRRQSQRQQVLDAVIRWPGSTTAELARLMKVWLDVPRRRMSELVTGQVVVIGPARICKECGSKCLTYWPVSLPIDNNKERAA